MNENDVEKSMETIARTVVDTIGIHENDPEIEEPKMESVVTSLLLLIDKDLGPYYIMNGFAFCAMFTSLTLLPIYIGTSPYNLNSGISGLCYLPVGIAFILGSMAGGASSDYAASRFQGSKAGRLIIPLILSITCPLGIIGEPTSPPPYNFIQISVINTINIRAGFGFSLHYKANLAAVLVSHVWLGFGQSALMPGDYT